MLTLKEGQIFPGENKIHAPKFPPLVSRTLMWSDEQKQEILTSTLEEEEAFRERQAFLEARPAAGSEIDCDDVDQDSRLRS